MAEGEEQELITMPVSTYDKEYVKKLLGFEIDDDTLKKNLESMGSVLKRITQKEIDVEYEADRPDLMSAVGLARALRYFMQRSERFDYAVLENTDKVTIDVGKHAARIRPYIAAIMVRKVKLSKEALLDVINFTEKLSENYGRRRKRIALGLHDLRDAKPPFQYDAFTDDEYVPLGEKAKMKYSEVMEKLVKGERYKELCTDGKRYVALKDGQGAMSLIPVLNSERTRVSEATKDMLVDITGSSRYIVERTSDMVASYFIDMGFEVHSVTVNYGKRSVETPAMEKTEIKMPMRQIEEEIGVLIAFNNAITLANKMGHEAALVGTKIRFRAPAYRLDILNEQDIIEDIAIAYGYDYIQPVQVPATQQGQLDKNELRNDMLREIMVGMGFAEELNSYMTNEAMDFDQMKVKRRAEYIKIRNAKASTITMLRTWLLPSLLADLGKSQHDRFPQRIFELDMAFGLVEGKPAENYHLAAAEASTEAGFNEMKASIMTVAKAMGRDLELVPAAHGSFIEGRCAGIVIDGQQVGIFGEVHPEVLANFGIEEPTVALDMNLAAVPLRRRQKQE